MWTATPEDGCRERPPSQGQVLRGKRPELGQGAELAVDPALRDVQESAGRCIDPIGSWATWAAHRLEACLSPPLPQPSPSRQHESLLPSASGERGGGEGKGGEGETKKSP